MKKTKEDLVHVRLSEAQIAWLDSEATITGVNRSQRLRFAIDFTKRVFEQMSPSALRLMVEQSTYEETTKEVASTTQRASYLTEIYEEYGWTKDFEKQLGLLQERLDVLEEYIGGVEDGVYEDDKHLLTRREPESRKEDHYI